MIKITSFKQLIAVFIAFIIVLLLCRFAYSGKLQYIFLLWNLFLAWIPFQLSLLLNSREKITRFRAAILLSAWLLFFPNALYIITDLVHLQALKMPAPIWFDAILLFTSSVTGLILAFASLFKIESFLQTKVTKPVVEKMIIASLFLGSFGVYLGRFLRWNSWDIFTNPLHLIMQLPLQHFRTWGVTLLLTCLFSLLYFGSKKLPGLLKEPGNNLIP